MSPRTKVAA